MRETLATFVALLYSLKTTNILFLRGLKIENAVLVLMGSRFYSDMV